MVQVERSRPFSGADLRQLGAANLNETVEQIFYAASHVKIPPTF